MEQIQSFLSSLHLGEPTGTPDLTVFPLMLTGPALDPVYDTLKDAIVAGHARVTEVSDDGRVPELRVVNDGSRPVLIVDGEELVGAKQNRVVNLTILVPAHLALTIPVSCVEAGRWDARSPEFSSADRTLHASGRRAKVEQVSSSLRASVAAAGETSRTESRREVSATLSRLADQSAIWAEIDVKSARMGAASDTRAAAAMFEQKQHELDVFTRTLQPVEGQVGAIFAIRGVIAGLDAFDAPQTCVRVMAGLVRSYGLDALDTEQGGNGFAKPDPRAFLDALTAATVESFPAVGLGTDLRVSGKGVVGGSLVSDDHVVHLLAFPAGGTVRPTGRNPRRRVY